MSTAEPARESYPPQRGPILRPLLQSYFFLVTLVLAIIAWFIALVAQAVATAKVGNSSVGVLWFAIFVQAYVIIGLVSGLTTNTLPLYQHTLSTFTSIAIVFAVIGVDRNIYSPSSSSQKALAAGWLITAIVDILWVLYFTVDSNSFIRRIFDTIGGSRTSGSAGRNTSSIPSVRTNVDGFSYPPAPAGGPRSPNGTESKPRESTPVALSADGTRATSGGTTDGRVTSGVPSGGVSGENAAPVPPGATEKSKEFLWRAEAQYSYDAQPEDPNELSFKKGDILEVADKSGKWWEARKSDGTTGIAPSNYLQLI
ncbi:High osmolarity signaling protein SHO1 [Hypsizygus marmoreus]|uniref:High osmolarity signaling protein SHO1 n=1 Tax=Hypsizygus marmoreus TaxID=39966 RepID=A0A369J4M5_HYPMA|nr:High osmolarity signaling protein SHO1 [Hypsizygus marmoreus]